MLLQSLTVFWQHFTILFSNLVNRAEFECAGTNDFCWFRVNLLDRQLLCIQTSLFAWSYIQIQLNIFLLSQFKKQTSILTAIFLSMGNRGWGGITYWVGVGLWLGLGRAFSSGVWVGLWHFCVCVCPSISSLTCSFFSLWLFYTSTFFTLFIFNFVYFWTLKMSLLT